MKGAWGHRLTPVRPEDGETCGMRRYGSEPGACGLPALLMAAFTFEGHGKRVTVTHRNFVCDAHAATFAAKHGLERAIGRAA